MVIPECPYPLLGWNLLPKVKAQIHFSSGGAKLLNDDGKPVYLLVINDMAEEYRLQTPSNGY